MESRSNAPSLGAVLAAAADARMLARGRLSDRGLDPDCVIGATHDGSAVDLTAFYDILGVISVSEKAGQSPTYALARLAVRAGLPSKISDALFLAYNQQSAEEAGHGDKVFANAHFAMGGVAPSPAHSVFGDGDEAASTVRPTDDETENRARLTELAATLGGIETAALQRVFPFLTTLCGGWNHPIARDLSLQIRDVVRPEESRHVLTWRYVFHHLVAPKGRAAIDEYLRVTNAGRAQLAASELDSDSFKRMVGTSRPSVRQLLGKHRTLYA